MSAAEQYPEEYAAFMRGQRDAALAILRDLRTEQSLRKTAWNVLKTFRARFGKLFL